MDNLSPGSYMNSRRSSRSSIGSGDFHEQLLDVKTMEAQCTIFLNDDQISEKSMSGEDDPTFENIGKEDDTEEKSIEQEISSPSCKMFNREDKLSDIIKELDDISIFEFHEAFDLFDLNNDGVISHSDLKNTFMSLGEKPNDEEITRMLSEAPKPLDMEGFIKLMACRTLQLDSEAVLIKAISKWDPENTGLVSYQKIKNELMSHGEKFTEDEVKSALDQAPVTVIKGRTMLEYQPLCKTICGVRRLN